MKLKTQRFDSMKESFHNELQSASEDKSDLRESQSVEEIDQLHEWPKEFN